MAPGRYDVTGRAVDAAARTPPVRVRVHVDGRARTGVTADRPWAGYASTFPDAGPSHASTARALAQGNHTVCTYGIAPLGGYGDRQRGCRTITV